jgi:hypothetical protein
MILLAALVLMGCGGSSPVSHPEDMKRSEADAMMSPDLSSPPPNKSCKGTIACAEYHLQSGCEKVGCTWTPAPCSGTPEACSAQHTQFFCEHQYGCAWSGGVCVGVPTPCSQFTGTCKLQTGCDSSFTCNGPSTQACAASKDEDACTAIGCNWE